jgi:hypothetical protein
MRGAMMPVTTDKRQKTGGAHTPVERAIVAALRKLPPDYLPEVLRYIEFLDYKIRAARGEAAEETALWAAVEANQEYKQRHSEEELEIHETGADFLTSVADL